MMLFVSQDYSLTNRQTEELAKFSLDVSKLALGSLVLGLFTSGLSLYKILLALWGLTVTILFFTLGIRLFKEVK